MTIPYRRTYPIQGLQCVTVITSYSIHYTKLYDTDIPAKQAPILIATAVTILATFVQIGIVWLKHRKVDTMLWVSLVIVTLLGGATLFFHDPTFIKWIV